MGTRADFYIGRGENAEWVGSIAWDGYPQGITPRKFAWLPNEHLFDATDKNTYLARLEMFFRDRDDVTRPEEGWPWPWDDSNTTDYAYTFDDEKVWTTNGCGWFDPRGEEPEDGPAVTFPDMSKRKNVAFDSKKSGLIIITA